MKKKSKKVTIYLSDQEFLVLAKMAHEQDITFNKLVNNLLIEYLNELKTEYEKEQGVYRRPVRTVTSFPCPANKRLGSRRA